MEEPSKIVTKSKMIAEGVAKCSPPVLPRRILLVDDDPLFREEFGDLFRDYGVCEAGSGAEALRVLSRPNEIELVFLDVRMPGLNGIEVLERIKKEAPNIRIVIMTGHSSTEVVVEALRKKADDYLTKPVNPAQIEKLVQKMMWTASESPAGKGDDAEVKVRHIQMFMQKNRSKKITLRDAAALVCLSPKYLSRVFREHAKMGFKEYKLALKMDMAKDLLKNTHFSVGFIADKLAYSNPESFVRQFKKAARLTPSAFRKKFRKK